MNGFGQFSPPESPPFFGQYQNFNSYFPEPPPFFGQYQNSDSHYGPVHLDRPRLHRRDFTAPPAYSAPYRRNYQQDTRGPMPLMSPLPILAAGITPPAQTYNQSFAFGAAFPHDPGYSEPQSLSVFVAELKSIRATIRWTAPSCAYEFDEPYPFMYVVSVTGGNRPLTYEMANWKKELFFACEPGTYYSVTVEVVDQITKAIRARGKTEFKAIFDKDELLALYDLAAAFLKSRCNPKRPTMQRFYHFYRNKPSAYYDNIHMNANGLMQTYRKDDNGHPGSPINGEINGLFFNARLPKGKKPISSPFGDIRYEFPAACLLTPNHNLYFADFYCNKTEHYITVVCCIPDSQTDNYCRRHLLQLDLAANEFLHIHRNANGSMEYYINATTWVEFLYTEDVYLSLGTFERMIATGTSRVNGLPNNKHCALCNLYPASAPSPPPNTFTSGGTTAGVKRKLDTPQNSIPPVKKSKQTQSVLIPILPIVERAFSTFHRAMEEERKAENSTGKRLECRDPNVVETVSNVVTDVLADASVPKYEPKPLLISVPEGETPSHSYHSPESKSESPPKKCTPVDEELEDKKIAIKESRAAKSLIEEKLKIAQDLINELRSSVESTVKQCANIIWS